jgi:hypothetical protein
MGAKTVQRLTQSLSCLAVIAGIAGCPHFLSGTAHEPSAIAQNPATTPTENATENASAENATENASAENATEVAVVTPSEVGTVPFSVCANLSDWQRPSVSDQQKLLTSDPRYAGALDAEPLRSMSQNLWSHPVISFTTYGLSARTEPLNFSGLWQVADQLWTTCYASTEGDRINTGELAEAWLINHRISSLRWENERYVLVVEPANTGVQVVQFTRVDRPQGDQPSPLSIEVVTANGETVPTVSGDWQ